MHVGLSEIIRSDQHSLAMLFEIKPISLKCYLASWMKLSYAICLKTGYILSLKLGHILSLKLGYTVSLKLGYTISLKLGYILSLKLGYIYILGYAVSRIRLWDNMEIGLA